jgi:TM2 domain-containing membrane protein YozV
MNCYLHSESPATAFCRDCGRALCADCQHLSNGTIFCQEHAPVTAYNAPPASGQAANPYQQTATPANASPGLAFLLGLIPGVGAIYNGQYAKGLVHAAIVGLLLSLANATDGSSGQAFIIMVLVAFWCYMAFEAFHTAKKRQAGLPVDEFSSLISPNVYTSRVPIGPLVLIGLGVLFLLDTLNLLAFRQLARFWPVLLIIAGLVMLFNRLSSLRSHQQPIESMESRHEQ